MKTFVTKQASTVDQLASEYSRKPGGAPHLQGVAPPLPSPTPGVPPVNVQNIAQDAIMKANPALMMSGITEVRETSLPGAAIGLNRSDEPHVFYVDVEKIALLARNKLANEVQVNVRGATPQNQQLVQQFVQRLQKLIGREVLATMFHEKTHEDQMRNELQQAETQHRQPRLQVPEGPAEMAEHQADAFFPGVGSLG
jgi:hypothetical protein